MAQPYAAQLQRVFATGQPQEHFGAFPTPAGEQHYHTRLVPELRDGQVHTALSIARNVTALKRAETELHRRRDLFKAVFNSSPLALQVLRSVRDADGRIVDFTVVLANATEHRMAGRDVTGRRRLGQWPHAKAAGLFDQLVAVVETGQPLDVEQPYVGDGFDSWFRWTAVRLDDGAVVNTEDVTPRKVAEAAVRTAHAQLNAIFEAVPAQLGYFHAVRDANGQLVDLRSVMLNPAADHHLGPSGATSGRLMSAQLPGLRALPVWQTIAEVLATGQPQRREVYHDFGSAAHWFDAQYVRLGDGLISASLDITARKQAEQDLRSSKELVEAVFNATLDSLEVLTSVRDAAGHIVDFEWALTNAAAHRLLQRDDVVGRRLLVEEPGMQPSGVFERLRQVAEQQQAGHFEVHYPYDGPDAWYRVAAAPLGDGLVVMWHDISDRKQATADLLRLQLAQQQQLANAVLDAQEVERRRIAEDLHNGLGQLLYAIQLQLEQLPGLPEPAAADGRRRAQQLLVAAIAQTRALSHELIPTVLEDFGLGAALRDICSTFSAPQLRLRCQAEALEPVPPTLALALYRIAQELAHNIARHAGATEASLQLSEHDGWLEFRAHDNGHGFDPTQPPSPGHGLKALRDRVQLLNGELAVTSSPKHGTDIRVRVSRTVLEVR